MNEFVNTDMVLAVATVIASFAIMKYKVGENDKKVNSISDDIKILIEFMNSSKPHLEHLSRVENAFGKKIDNHAQIIVELQQITSQAPTMKEVREEFVSKEMFYQMEKHIDEKFTILESGIQRILDKLEKENVR